VTDTTDTTRRRGSRLALARRVVGMVLLAATAVAAVLFVVAIWNPARLVFLEYQFGNPLWGGLIVPVGALIGLWLGLPVRNEARQRWRIAARWTALALSIIGLISWGLFGRSLAMDVEEVARSSDGERTLVIASTRDTVPRSYLRVWVGSGLTAREVGEIGHICGQATVRFITDDQVELQTSYGDWVIDLDPATGEPRQVLGPRCSDGPIPATLGP
jgi:hypothetical protein